MIKKLKHFICKLFKIKACQCDDEQVEVSNKTEDKPTHCGSHTRFIKSCHQCLAVTQG